MSFCLMSFDLSSEYATERSHKTQKRASVLVHLVQGISYFILQNKVHQ